MIDWFNVAANSVWIFACSLALATLSYASWQASLSGARLRDQLARRAPQTWLNLSAFLFCLGLAAAAGAWWQSLLWLILAVVFAAQLWTIRKGVIQ